MLGEKGKNGLSLVLTNRGWRGPRRICGGGGRGREAVKQKYISSPIIPIILKKIEVVKNLPTSIQVLRNACSLISNSSAKKEKKKVHTQKSISPDTHGHAASKS